MNPDRLRLGVLASGRGSNLQALLDAADEGRIRSRVALVVSDQEDAKALDRARAHGAAAHTVLPDPAHKGQARRQAHEAAIHELLTAHKADLVVLAGYMRILGPWLLERWTHRIINVHPALLPSFPGLHGQRQALAWGVRIAGCTTHYVDEKTDHGPVLLQAATPVRPDDTDETLSRRILRLEHQILPRTVHLIEQGRVRVDGRRVHIRPDASWTQRYPTEPDALYAAEY